MGLLLPEIDEAYGGSGVPMSFQLTLQDELALAEAPCNGVHTIAAHYIVDYGTPEQKQRWLPRLVSGELVAAIAMTEPGCGSDLKALRTRARRDGDHYVIDGSKTFITQGFTANLIVVAVRTGEAGSKGVSLVVLETEVLAGFRVGRRLEKIGLHALDTAEMFFDAVRVPAAAAIELALELTVAYCKQRQAFGKTLFEFQNTRFKLAECATIAHVVRTFVNDCVQRMDDGTLDNDAAYMAKWWTSEQQGKVMDECLQLFGGYGYMAEYPIARLYTDARVQRIYGGTTEIMKDLIARNL